MLLLGLTLIASFSAPAPAWAQETTADDIGAAVEETTDDAAAVVEDAEEAAEEAVELTEAELEELTAKVTAEVEELNAAIPAVLEGEYYYEVGEDDDGLPTAVLFNLTDWKTNNLWIMIAGMLVFMMHLGFAMVESGLTRAKNTVNILFKNTAIVMIGIVVYAVFGWIVMYPGDGSGAKIFVDGYFALGFGIQGGGVYYTDGADYAGITPAYNAGYTVWTDFFFQAMFAATCCTIVSGAVAGRVKLLPFLLFCIPFVGIVYCTVGYWKWGGGWLDAMGFEDYAGSTLVHAVGGAGALAGALLLGPRIGKYAKDGTVQPIPGHSMPLATIGVFLLWFGWFGFNGGSELTADPAGVSYVLVTTTMAACGGGIAAAIISWIFGGKPDLSMTLNGILAGLVGITAGPNVPSWIGAFIICGVIPGVLVYFSVLFFDKIKIDDPVGAISVHGVCGIYGTLAVAFSGAFEGNFGNFGVQLIGTAAGFIFAFVCAFVILSVLKMIFGLRVSAHEEIEGLDLGEHDMSAYPDFQQTLIKSYHAREI